MTNAGKAGNLQQISASGKKITVLKKVDTKDDEKAVIRNMISSTLSSDILGKQTSQISSPYLQNLLNMDTDSSQPGYVSRYVGKQEATKIQTGQDVVKSHAFALKVTQSGVIVPANTQLLNLVTSFKAQQQEALLLNNRFKIISILPGQNMEVVPRGSSPKKQTAETAFTTNVTKITSHSRLSLDMSNRSNTRQHIYNITVPTGRSAPTVKSIVCHPFPSTAASHDNQGLRNTTITHKQSMEQFRFPAKPLLSMNVSNTRPTHTELYENKAASLKMDSWKSNTEVKAKTQLSRKLIFHNTSIREDKKTETWPEPDVPLSAISLQNGLQRVLSMTPFSPFLDDDVPEETNKETKATEPCIVPVPRSVGRGTNFARSQQIIDEQLAKISQNLERAEKKLSGIETLKQGQKFGMSGDGVGEIKATNSINKNADSNRKVKVKHENPLTSVVLDNEDIDEGPRITSYDVDSLTWKAEDIARIKAKANETRETLHKSDSLQTKDSVEELKHIVRKELKQDYSEIANEEDNSRAKTKERNTQRKTRDYEVSALRNDKSYLPSETSPSRIKKGVADKYGTPTPLGGALRTKYLEK